MLDCLARILDPDLSAVFPQGEPIDPLEYGHPQEPEYNPMTWDMD